MNREELEIKAKSYCPPEMWYELLDTLDETPDSDLYKLIKNEESIQKSML